MHKIIVTPASAIIEARLSGFLSEAAVKAYTAEAEPIIRQCAARGAYRMLIDVSCCAIQSQETVCAFQRHVAGLPQARRLAVVTGSSMVRMQVRRIMSGPGMEMFTSREDALGWLSQASTPHAGSV